MRSDLDLDSENLFERRKLEKDSQRAALFGWEGAVRDDEFQSYIRQQIIENPKRVSVGKPAFAPKF
jgi:hypothetical protein